MKNNKLTIGQMAKLNKTTVPTLRLYERLGLLVPAYINPDNGYRYYDITQSVVFRAIQYNTNLTVSLKELQTVIEHHDYHLVKQIYENKLQDVKSEIKALTAKKHMLYKTINWLEHYRQMPPAGTFTLEFLPTEYVYTLPVTRDYFHEDFGSYVYGILKLTDQMDKDKIPYRYQYFTCMTIRREDYLNSQYTADRMGIYVDAPLEDYPHVSPQKGQMYVCTYLTDFGQLSSALDELKTFCHSRNCTVSGDVICRLIGSLDVENFLHPSPFLRLQVPVLMDDAPALSSPFL